MNQRILSLTTIGALVASIALVGCSKTEQQNAKNRADSTVATVEKRANEVGNQAAAGIDRARDAAANASAKMSDKIDDVVITTNVKTELAKDPKLSVLAINVDTDQGRVALKGTAPTSTARQQATTLAQNVRGVVSVDNQLAIRP